MPRPPTQQALLDEIARIRLEIRALTEYADELERLARKAPLTIARNRSMVGSNVEANLEGKPENVRTSANRARRKSAARDAMIAGNHVAADLARAAHVGRSTLNAYLNGTRPAPPLVVSRLAAPPWNIPAASWPRLA